jgi:hypothetical protein
MSPVDIRARIVQFTAIAEPVEVPELGTVHIRRITLGELDTIRKETPATKDVPQTVRLLAAFIGDEQGKPVFAPDKPDDVAAINSLPVKAAAEILRQGNKVNAMGEVDAKKE